MKKLSILLLLTVVGNNVFAQTKDTPTMKEFLGRKDKTVYNVTVADAAYKIVYDYNGANYISTIPVTLDNYLSIRTSSLVPSVSVITVPFKVRPSRGTLPQNVNAAIKNAAVFVGPFLRTERYFASGTKSTHKFAFGLLVGPSSEEFTPENTGGKVAKSTQLTLSTGLGFTYTYNAISFAIVPLGFDYAMTGPGHDWAYHKKRWYGFGIGVDTKLFGF